MAIEAVPNNTGAESRRCSVVILHETADALANATTLCDRIMAEVWCNLDIELQQWPFVLLSEGDHSEEAAAKAAAANVVVVAATGAGEFPPEFMRWTERLVGLRQHHDGALVGLFAPGTGKEGGGASRDLQLHQVALRAGMDYLNHLPHDPSLGIPDLLEWCAARAETLTDTLDEIIRTTPHA